MCVLVMSIIKRAATRAVFFLPNDFGVNHGLFDCENDAILLCH